jgi:putative ABC transport system permease protein
MKRTLVLLSVKNSLKDKRISILNILGLSIGISVFLLISTYIIGEIRYDKNTKNYSKIYRFANNCRPINKHIAGCAAPFAAAIKKDFPEVEDAMRISKYKSYLINAENKGFFEKRVLYADSNFFKFFNNDLVSGSLEKCLQEPFSAVLTKSISNKYFGLANPIGKAILIDSIPYKVTAVVQDISYSNHIKYDLLLSMSSDKASKSDWWLDDVYYTYLIIRNENNARILEKKLTSIITNYIGPQYYKVLKIELKRNEDWGTYYLEPLSGIHLHSIIQDSLEPSGDIRIIVAFWIAAIMIVLLTCFNYINLTTAFSYDMSKEIALRKVFGELNKSIVKYFLLETFINVFIALIIGSFICILLLPGFNNIIEQQLSFKILLTKGYLIYLYICLIISITLFAGLLPSIKITSVEITHAFRNVFSNKASNVFSGRKLLVLFQYIISFIILTTVIIIIAQINYLNYRDLGFSKKNILIVSNASVLKGKKQYFKEQILQSPDVISASYVIQYPGSQTYNNEFFFNGLPDKTYVFYAFWGDLDFVNTFGFNITGGRGFQKDINSDYNAILVNENSVKVLPDKNLIDKELKFASDNIKMHIVGIVKDFNFRSQHTLVEPAMLCLCRPEDGKYLCVRISGNNVNQSVDFIKQKWNQLNPGIPIMYSFLYEDLMKYYKIEEITKRILSVFLFFAIIISIIGILGFVSYNTLKRQKEIGIRRVFGGSVLNIELIFFKEIISVILLSSFISMPLVYLIINKWIENFAYRINISFSYFIYPILILFLITIISSFGIILTAARSNPIKVLKTE